jgi:hypothetical protein
MVPALTILLFQNPGAYGTKHNSDYLFAKSLCALMHHCSGDNEQVAYSACSAFLKDVFHALCKVYEVCTVMEKNLYVPRYFSSFINIHDNSLVMDPK